jgi:CubicO group peptidase (beta-lactamase class C family)
MWYVPAPPDPSWSLERVLAEGRDPDTGGPFTVVAAPGTEVRYSGGGYALLQLAIERVTGKRFEAWAHRNLFAPLGMTHTRFVSWDEAARTMAVGYDGWRERVPPEHQLGVAEGGLTTTAGDLARWVAELIAGLAGEPSAPLDAAHIARMVAPMPGSQGERGLGVVLEALPDGRVGVWHAGTNPGWDAMYYFVPAARAGIVVLTNGSEAGRYLAKSTVCAWQRIENGIADHSMCPPSTYAAVKGSYLLDGIGGAVARYARVRGDHEQDWNRHWHELNQLGYDLLKRGRIPDALTIFELNVQDHPEEWEVYDSLGDGLERAGRRAEARAAYMRAIELDPEDHSRPAADRTAGTSP